MVWIIKVPLYSEPEDSDSGRGNKHCGKLCVYVIEKTVEPQLSSAPIS